MNIDQVISDIEKRIFDISLMLNHEFGTEYDDTLSSNQQLLLFLIAKKDVKYVKDLAHQMNVSPSAISQMVAKLEQMKMVSREVDENNRRNTILKLGKEGFKMLEQIDKIRSMIINKYLSKMKQEDLEQLRVAFQTFYEIIIEEREVDLK